MRDADLIGESVPAPIVVYDPLVSESSRVWGDGASYRAHGASENGKWFATLDDHRVVSLWDVAQERVVNKISLPAQDLGHMFSLTVSNDGRLVAWTLHRTNRQNDDAGAMLWEVDSGLLRRFPDLPDALAVLFSPQGDRLAQVSNLQGEWQIRTWFIGTSPSKPFQQSVRFTPQYRAVYSPDGEVLSSTAWDGRVYQDIDARVRKKVRSFVAHPGQVRALAYTADGNAMLTGGEDEAIKIWDSRSNTLRATFPSLNATVEKLVLDRDERWLGVLLDGGPMTIWRIPTREEINTSSDLLLTRLEMAGSRGQWERASRVVEEMSGIRDQRPERQLAVLALRGDWERFYRVRTEIANAVGDPENVVDIWALAWAYVCPPEKIDLSRARLLAGRLYQAGDRIVTGLTISQGCAAILAHADLRDGQPSKTLEAVQHLNKYESVLAPFVRILSPALEALALHALDREEEARLALISAREMWQVNGPEFDLEQGVRYWSAYAYSFQLLTEAEQTIEGKVSSVFGKLDAKLDE